MKPWIVTGASRGLGAALADELAGRGHAVLALARDHAQLLALQQRWPDGQISIGVLDLAQPEQIEARLAHYCAPFSGLSGVINNAGIGYYKPFVEHSMAELQAILQVNLGAVMQICAVLVPRLIAQGHGHIVNIGSDLGRRPLANMAAYVAAKHGLTGFSHSLLRELKGQGVRVSLINPGMIDTHFSDGDVGAREEYRHLKPAALAKLIVDMTSLPGHMLVDELSVHPLGQAEF